MHRRPCLCRLVRASLFVSLGALFLPASAQARKRALLPAISNPAPFGDSTSRGNSFDDAPLSQPSVKANAAQTPATPTPDWTGGPPPPGVPAIPGVTYSNASGTTNIDPLQPPPALGPTPVSLDAIRAVQVGSQRLTAAPMRVGNLELLAPLVDVMSELGAQVSRADLRLVPGDQNTPIENNFFQINRPGQPPIVMGIGQNKAWINRQEQTLRAAPLVVDKQIYIPVFSLAPLLGAATRLDAQGTLVLSPTIESVQVFPVRGTLVVTVKASKAIPSGLKFQTMGDGGKNRLYVDFPGYAMGFDAISTPTPRVVAPGFGDILRVRAGMPSQFPDVVRVTLDLKRPLSGLTQPMPDPTLFTFVVTTPRVAEPPKSGGKFATELPGALQGFTVVLDAGHGGHDTGAPGATSLEKNHTLDTILRLKKQLEMRGANVLLTRGGDYFVTLQGRSDFANTRRADVFISIHNNSSPNRAARGTETFYYTAPSLALAREIHKELVPATGCPNRGIASERYWVLRKTWMPSVLLEVAFVSNPREEALLSSPEWSQRVAEGVARGVVNYYRIYKQGGVHG